MIKTEKQLHAALYRYAQWRRCVQVFDLIGLKSKDPAADKAHDTALRQEIIEAIGKENEGKIDKFVRVAFRDNLV